MGAQCKERSVDTPLRSRLHRRVSAVVASIVLEARQQRSRGSVAKIVRNGSPALREAGQVHQVEALAALESSQVGNDRFGGKGLLQGNEACESEDRVVEVAFAGAVLKAAVGIQGSVQESSDEIAGLTERPRREPRHLQHSEPQTHCTIP